MKRPKPDPERTKEVKQLRKLLSKGVSAKQLHNSIQEVLNYNWESEEEDFMEGDHTADLEEHVFGALIILEEYLRYQT